MSRASWGWVVGFPPPPHYRDSLAGLVVGEKPDERFPPTMMMSEQQSESPSPPPIGTAGGGTDSSLERGDQGRYHAISPPAVTRSKAAHARFTINDNLETQRKILRLCRGVPISDTDGNDDYDVASEAMSYEGSLAASVPSNDEDVERPPERPQKSSCRGMIYFGLLEQYTEKYLLTRFKSQSVTRVQKMMKNVKGVRTQLPSYIITFSLPRVPEILKVAWFDIRVRPYIEYPKRCFYCQMIGHVSKKCCRRSRGLPAVCCFCSGPAHGKDPCSAPLKCANCRGPHAASSNMCPNYTFERKVVANRDLYYLSLEEARDRVLSFYAPADDNEGDAQCA